MQFGEYEWEEYSWLPKIPIQNVEPFRDERPVVHSEYDIVTWPREEFVIGFDYNAADEQWHWQVDLVGKTTVVEHQPLLYGKPYQYRQYCLFIWRDPSGETTKITPQTIVDPVELIAIPGPRSPGWDEWASEQERLDVSQQETTPALGVR